MESLLLNKTQASYKVFGYRDIQKLNRFLEMAEINYYPDGKQKKYYIEDLHRGIKTILNKTWSNNDLKSAILHHQSNSRKKSKPRKVAGKNDD